MANGLAAMAAARGRLGDRPVLRHDSSGGDGGGDGGVKVEAVV